MDHLKYGSLSDLSHDLVFGGSQTFYNNILKEDHEPQYVIDYPYPIHPPFQYCNQDRVKKPNNQINTTRQINLVEKEFKKMKNKICGQKFEEYAMLPNFFINYMDVDHASDYGFNINYSSGVLEKFYHRGNLSFIRPDKENNLVIWSMDNSEDNIKFRWSQSIFDIKHMNLESSNSFIIRGLNNIYLMEIDNNLRSKVHLKLKCDIGYVDVALNNKSKSELAIVDTKSELTFFNLEKEKVLSTYPIKGFNLQRKPILTKINYLTGNLLMIMSDKQISLLDTRCREKPINRDIKLEPCDMLLNFTSNKEEQYLPDTVYMTSKHCYWVYDIRMPTVDNFIYHNLRSPPCFINCFQEQDINIVTIFSQTESERAIFGKGSPYSMPYHLTNLEDTFDRCRSLSSIPVVPNIDRRLNYSIVGVQLMENHGDLSLYFSNVLGELFRQDILLKNNYSAEPTRKMKDWLMQIYEMDNPDLNAVQLADATAAFELETDSNEVDLYTHYEENNLHEFFEDSSFDVKNFNSNVFLEIWDDDGGDIKLLVDSAPADSKVEEWIEQTEFENNA